MCTASRARIGQQCIGISFSDIPIRWLGPPQTPARALTLLANTPYGVAEPQAGLVVLLPSVAGFPPHFAWKTAAAAAKGLTRHRPLSYYKNAGGQRCVSAEALK